MTFPWLKEEKVTKDTKIFIFQRSNLVKNERIWNISTLGESISRILCKTKEKYRNLKVELKFAVATSKNALLFSKRNFSLDNLQWIEWVQYLFGYKLEENVERKRI